MRHFASSHIQPLALSSEHLVLPVRKVSAVPSFPSTRRFAAASASCWRPRRGAPLEASAQVRPSRGQTSACVVGRGAIASVGRPLLLGRLARVTRIRRVPSSAHRGRRIASADSCATRVACGGFAFASRIRIAHSAPAPAHVVPASPVNRSAPTHRSRGRCAMKPRSAPELKRWGSSPVLVLLAALDSCSGARACASLLPPADVCSRAHRRTRSSCSRSSSAPRGSLPGASCRSSARRSTSPAASPSVSAPRCVCPSSPLPVACVSCRCAFDPQPVSREGASPKAAQPPHFSRWAL